MSKAWMPFYGGDFFAGTMHLTTGQIGAYICLLWHYWEHGGLPDDDYKLARICRCRIEDWKRYYRPAMVEIFLPGWRHTRVEKELARSAEKLRKNNENRKNDAKIQHEFAGHNHNHNHKEEGKKKERNMRATSCALALDWRPSDDLDEYGKRLGFSTPEIEAMAEDMRLWAAANSHRAIGRKADWSATFRGWMRRKKGERDNDRVRFNGQGTYAHRGDKPTIQDALREHEQRLARELEGEGITSHEGGASASRLLPFRRSG